MLCSGQLVIPALLLLLSAATWGGGEQQSAADSCEANSAAACDPAPHQSHLYSVQANNWEPDLNLVQQAKVGDSLICNSN